MHLMRQNINLQLKTESVYSRLIDLKELSHDILSYFGQVQNYLQIEGKLNIIVYYKIEWHYGDHNNP